MKKGLKIVVVLLLLLGVAVLVGRRLLKPKEEVEVTQLPLATGIFPEKGDLSIEESLVGTVCFGCQGFRRDFGNLCGKWCGAEKRR